MYLSMLRKIKLTILFSLLMAGCCRVPPCERTIVIPHAWHATLEQGMTFEDPACFKWWEALNDPLLNTLISRGIARNNEIRLAAETSRDKWRETVILITSDIAKSYIQLRGLQSRLKKFQEQIEAQNNVFSLTEGLSDVGFSDAFEENENNRTLSSLEAQQTSLTLEIDTVSHHLAILLDEMPGCLQELLSCPQDLLKLPLELPIGTPLELVLRHPSIEQARKIYEKTHDKRGFYHYKQQILKAMEEAENALAALHHEREKAEALNQRQTLSRETYQITQDLYQRGIKDERAVQIAYLQMLSDENLALESQEQLLLDYAALYQALGSF